MVEVGKKMTFIGSGQKNLLNMAESTTFSCYFLHPMVLRNVGMIDYSKKCGKITKSLHPNVYP